MRFHRIARDLIFMLCLVYFSQDWLYVSGSAISKAALAGIIAISFYYLIRTILLGGNNSLLYTVWTVFLVLNIAGFFVNPDFTEGVARDTFKNILACLFPFYPFYYFARKGLLKPWHFLLFFVLMLPVTILQFYSYRNNILLEAGSTDMDVVNNISYSFVSLIPFVFLFRDKRLLSGASLAVLMFFIIQGSKRGAIIAGAAGVIAYIYYQLQTIEKGKKISGYFAVIILLAVLGVFAYKSFISNEFALERMYSISEGDSSYRETLYSTIYNLWLDCNNFWNYLFGFGLTTSLDLTRGDMAHSDWLQLLSSLGIAGVIVYMLFFYASVRHSLSSKWNSDKKLLMLTMTIIWFFVSLISMGYTSMTFFTYSMLFGFLTGDNSPALVRIPALQIIK